jgi:hypothetical protein
MAATRDGRLVKQFSDTIMLIPAQAVPAVTLRPDARCAALQKGYSVWISAV